MKNVLGLAVEELNFFIVASMALLPVAKGVAWNQGRFVGWLQFTRLVWGRGSVSRRELLQKEREKILLIAGAINYSLNKAVGLA